MSAIKQRIPFVILAGGLFVFIWWLCAATNIPFDANDPLNGARGICDVTGWDGPSAVYTCTEAQRELALEEAQERFNVFAGIMSALLSLGITLLLLNDRSHTQHRSSSRRDQGTTGSKLEPVSTMVDMGLIPKPSSRDKR